MLVKKPRPKAAKWLRKGAIIVFAVEAIGFVFSYKVWNEVNTDRESRKYLRDNYPSVLESYYKVGEFLDSKSNIRQIDSAYWNAEK